MRDFHLLSKSASVVAVSGLSLVLSACAGFHTEARSSSSMEGIKAFVSGDYSKAHDVFTAENQQDPQDLYAKYNLARTHQVLGERGDAVAGYRDVAAAGHDGRPDHSLEWPYDHITFTEAACRHLKELNVTDSNCPI